MKIGEVSRSTGVSARSLRYYEQIGLIRSERMSNGYRDYDDDVIASVETIKSLLELGFPTTLIELVLPCTDAASPIERDCSVLMAHIERIRDEMDEKAQRLAHTRDTLTGFLARQA